MNENFIRNLFAGIVDPDGIHPYPSMNPDERETVDMFLDQVKKFAEESIDGEAIDKAGVIPEEVLDGLKEMGIFGMIIPEAYGGYGFSLTAYSRVMEEISRHCASTSITIGAHESIGMKGIILFGNEEQKQKFLPDLATGEKLAAYALTEPDAGSDASNLKTVAKYDENENLFVLNGTKQWITNGGMADIYTLFASTGRQGIVTAFIVTSDMPGFSVGKYEDKLGLRASKTAQLILENVKVPPENILYKQGRGFKVAMEILNTGRASLSASCIGAAKEVMRFATDHALQRRQFGAPIAELEMIRSKFYAMASTIYAMESMVYHTTSLVDGNIGDYSTETAVSKFFCTDALWWIINECLQVSGGNGYMNEYPYQRFLRDARINMIFEGTNEVNRMYAGYTGLKHAARILGSETKPSGGSFAGFSPDSLKPYAEELDRLASRFGARCMKLVELHGPEAYKMEYHLERIADAVAGLYSGAAVLARTAAAGDNSKALALARGYLELVLPKIRYAMDAEEHAADEIKDEISSLIYEGGGFPHERWAL
ncbi:MAG TPA: acyl-CoA dehydrogenase family protein [Thermoanaerobaculia bacterium]|nr:acyl-CoA dehydrogenase family protein [Thermoanaerobaculia bacterium]HUM29921.1 acyl-CoA dehydrogenase family protein [Thermoanaerobaculia bacterium]HXK68212.1 acyl-CoA dehydrogenase family protein [Thermoanaerobaculia bacterium]